MNNVKSIVTTWYGIYESHERNNLKNLPLKRLIDIFEGDEVNENRANGDFEYNYDKDLTIELIIIRSSLRVAVTNVERNPDNLEVLNNFLSEYNSEKKSYFERKLNVDHFNLDEDNLRNLVK